MSALAVIHIAKKQLALDDDTYRDVLVRVTGKSSSANMTEEERSAVIAEMKRLGFSQEEKSSKDRPRPLEGPFAAKLIALWLSGWHLGVVRNKHDYALLAFVKRQTGIDHTRFLHYPDDAAKAIEAIKAMLARPVEQGGGGVDWTQSNTRALWTQNDRARVAIALVARAEQLGLFGSVPFSAQARIEHVAGRPVLHFRTEDWIKVHRHFGERIRKALAAKAAEPSE